jgi:hypothetical protein
VAVRSVVIQAFDEFQAHIHGQTALNGYDHEAIRRALYQSVTYVL